MCLYPKLVKNPKYRPNKKNKGIVPHMSDERVGLIPVGCGMCMECMKQKANNWRLRLQEDIKEHTNGKFITLTYSNESYAKLAEEVRKKHGDINGYLLDNEIATLSVRRFLERWRKKYKKSVRHWLITELGHTGTEHLHMHGIIWADDVNEIETKWQYGWVWKGKKQGGQLVNYVSARTINYIIKYVTKVDTDHKCYKPIVLCSPGIGANYTKTYNATTNKYKEKDTKTTYTATNGKQAALPIYWRNKLYTEQQREKLWLEKLDQNVRWVGGEKVKANDDETYYGLLKHYRKLNKQLGYGSPGTWAAEEYENERRKLKQNERMQPKRLNKPPAAFQRNSFTPVDSDGDGNKLPLATTQSLSSQQREIDWEKDIPF